MHKLNKLSFTARNYSSGFTLVELLVVIGVLGVLATGLLIAINPAQQLAKARDSARKSALKQIRGALESYRIANGTYPNTGWWIYSHQPAWQTFLGSELKRVPTDPTQTGCAAGYPWANGYSCWWLAYGSNGTVYDLVAHLENVTDSDRCEIKKWPFQAAGGTSWCPPGNNYSNYIYAPSQND